MALSTYDELKQAVQDHLNRDDLSSYVGDFIALAEAKFNRDHRLRNVLSSTLTVSGDDTQLPAAFRELISLYHDGSSYYGSLEIVTPGELGNRKGYMSTAGGVPLAAAIVGGAGTKYLRVAPVPTSSYSLKMIYSAYTDALTDSNTSNWLLEVAPDIYLYGTLVEAEAFLQEDNRVQLWKALLDEALQKHYINDERTRFGGKLSRFPARSIGESY